MPWAPLEFETKLKATGKHGARSFFFSGAAASCNSGGGAHHVWCVAVVERRWWGPSFSAPLGLLDAHARGPPRVHTLLTLCLPFYSSVPSHVHAVHAHLRRTDFVLEPISCAAVSRTNGAPTRRSTRHTPAASPCAHDHAHYVILAIANPRSPYGGERKRTREGLGDGRREQNAYAWPRKSGEERGYMVRTAKSD